MAGTTNVTVRANLSLPARLRWRSLYFMLCTAFCIRVIIFHFDIHTQHGMFACNGVAGSQLKSLYLDLHILLWYAVINVKLHSRVT